MSKDRLETIKSNVSSDYGNEGEYNKIVSKSDLDYLIEQAERAIELKYEIKSHTPEGRNYTNQQYIELLNEHQRYKEALEEIALGLDEYCSDGIDDARTAINALKGQ